MYTHRPAPSIGDSPQSTRGPRRRSSRWPQSTPPQRRALHASTGNPATTVQRDRRAAACRLLRPRPAQHGRCAQPRSRVAETQRARDARVQSLDAIEAEDVLGATRPIVEPRLASWLPDVRGEIVEVVARHLRRDCAKVLAPSAESTDAIGGRVCQPRARGRRLGHRGSGVELRECDHGVARVVVAKTTHESKHRPHIAEYSQSISSKVPSPRQWAAPLCATSRRRRTHRRAGGRQATQRGGRATPLSQA